MKVTIEVDGCKAVYFICEAETEPDAPTRLEHILENEFGGVILAFGVTEEEEPSNVPN